MLDHQESAHPIAGIRQWVFGVIERARRRARRRRLASAAGLVALLGAIALAISVAGGPNPATPVGENSPQVANFSAPPGSDPVPVLTAGELTIEAGCTQTTNGPSLTVFATTSAEKATIVSAYTGNGFDRERKFVVEDYGRDFGGYDFVGSVYADLEGTLRYSSPREDAEIAFAVDKATPGGDCRFRASTVGT